MKHIIKRLTFASFLWFTGCSSTYYAGILGSRITPVNHAIMGKEQTHHSIGGNIEEAIPSHSDEVNRLFKLHYQYTRTEKHVALEWNAPVYAGYHSVSLDNTDEFDGNHLYFGALPNLAASLFVPIKQVRLGLILRTGAYAEIGPYSTFRHDASSKGVIRKVGDNINFVGSTGIFLDYSINQHNLISLQSEIGLPGLTTITLAYKYKSDRVWFSIAPYSVGFSHDL